MIEGNDNTPASPRGEMIVMIDSLLEKIKANDATVAQHQTIATTTGNLTNQIIEMIQRIIIDMNSGDGDASEKLSRSIDSLTTLVSSLESNKRSVEDEAIRVEAIQEGMRRALVAARITGLQSGSNDGGNQPVEQATQLTSFELP